MPLKSSPASPAFIIPPGVVPSTTAAVWPSINRALFMRFSLSSPGLFRYVNWRCGTQSGNIQLGVVTLSGVDHADYTRVVHTGIIACPAGAANYRTDLGVFTLPPGDHAAFLWADNVTFQTATANNTQYGPLRLCGLHSTLATGVLESGTMTYATNTLTISLEGNN